MAYSLYLHNHGKCHDPLGLVAFCGYPPRLPGSIRSSFQILRIIRIVM